MGKHCDILHHSAGGGLLDGAGVKRDPEHWPCERSSWVFAAFANLAVFKPESFDCSNFGPTWRESMLKVEKQTTTND